MELRSLRRQSGSCWKRLIRKPSLRRSAKDSPSWQRTRCSPRMATRAPSTAWVQEVVRGRIPEEHRREWIEPTLRVVKDYAPFDADDVRTWRVWNVLTPPAAAGGGPATRR